MKKRVGMTEGMWKDRIKIYEREERGVWEKEVKYVEGFWEEGKNNEWRWDLE